LPDRSEESTQKKRETLVLQVGDWVDGPATHHPEKNTHAKKPKQRLGKYVIIHVLKYDVKLDGNKMAVYL